MKNLYFFSEKKLAYVEIKNFYLKFLSLINILSILIAFIIFSLYFMLNNIVNKPETVKYYKNLNAQLELKYNGLSQRLEELNNQIEILRAKDSDLRLSVNLVPRTKEEFNIGLGGSNELLPSNIEVSNISKFSEILEESIENLNAKVIIEQSNYSEIEESIIKNKKLFTSIPAIKPCDGAIGDRFGMRFHPILKINRMHTGVDLVVDTGTKIFATGGGKIIDVSRKSGYGLVVEIDHGFGYRTLYAHLSKTLVSKNQKIDRGDLIGLSGQSGTLATGPHLHYEVMHNGVYLNPANFIFEDVKLFDVVSQKGSI